MACRSLLILAALLAVGMPAVAFQHAVVVEEFTNTECPGCSVIKDTVDAILAARAGQVVPIRYHMNWPGSSDPIHHWNPTEALDRKTYYQFIVSASGARYEGKEKDSSWNAEWKARVGVDGERKEWTAELFVPWTSLGFERAPARGTRLGLNYARHRNPVAEDYQWNCTYGSNHRPEWFGTAELE